MVHPIAEANEKSPFGSLTPLQFYRRHSVSHSSEYITNSSGLQLFTQWWIPLPPTKVIGTLSVLHGFRSNSSWIPQLTSVHFAKSGFATCAIDYQGHGNSQGLQEHIPDINVVAHDCAAFFHSFRSRYPYLPSFLYGESLGGAIALLTHLNHSNNSSTPWAGIVLHGAMCGLSRSVMPPWPLEHLSSLVAWLVPTWKIIPARSLLRWSLREEWKRKLLLACPNLGVGLPRAATANEFIRVCAHLQTRYHEVMAPLLIVHGGADSICDPSSVEKLYEQAGSTDKTIHVYPGMWHILVGESDDKVELVFGEIVDWLLARAQQGPPLEFDGNRDDGSTITPMSGTGTSKPINK